MNCPKCNTDFDEVCVSERQFKDHINNCSTCFKCKKTTKFEGGVCTECVDRERDALTTRLALEQIDRIRESHPGVWEGE